MDINKILDKAEEKARTMVPDNSAPLMTHDIEEEGCDGLESCPIHLPAN